jgi:hypothetical protein
VYSPEELRNMNADDINALIARDLYEDAYKSQALSPVPYRGKRLAEKLEHVLYLCPACAGWEALFSQNDRITCKLCGHSVSYTEWGLLNGGRFDTVAKWSQWQKEQLETRLLHMEQSFLFSDRDQKLFRVIPLQKSELLASGELSMDKTMLRLGSFSIALTDIQDMAMVGTKTITFSAADKLQYEIKSDTPLNAVKYLSAYKILKRRM